MNMCQLMFKDKTVLVTGGTGSLGQALTKRLLSENVETMQKAMKRLLVGWFK